MMKKWSLLVVLLISKLVCFAQQNNPAIPADGYAVLMLDSLTGNEIDSTEKVTFHLFPFITKEEFASAQFFMTPDNKTVLAVELKNGNVRTFDYTRADINNTAYLVRYYSGNVPRAEGLSSRETSELVVGSVKLIDAIIKAKSCSKLEM